MFGGANIGGSVGAALGSKSEKKAYKNAQEYMYKLGQEAQKTSQLADPYQQYRPEMASMLNDYVTGKRTIDTDPGYQFQQQEGQRGVERAAAARGMGNSGNVMAALQQRGQDIASQQYGSIIDRLTNLAGASSQNAIAGGQLYGNMMTTSLTGQADAAIGKGMAASRQSAAWGDVAHNTALLVGSLFSSYGMGGGTNTDSYASKVGGGGGYAGGPDYGSSSSAGGMGGFDISQFFGGSGGGGGMIG